MDGVLLLLSCFAGEQDYKVNPGGAQPYATISVYDDLVDSKGLGLIRADITPNLTKKVQSLLST